MKKEEKTKAQPENLPEPTYWPFFTALGCVFAFWGILTNWIVSLVGFIVLIISIRGWIVDLFNELKN